MVSIFDKDLLEKAGGGGRGEGTGRGFILVFLKWVGFSSLGRGFITWED